MKTFIRSIVATIIGLYNVATDRATKRMTEPFYEGCYFLIRQSGTYRSLLRVGVLRVDGVTSDKVYVTVYMKDGRTGDNAVVQRIQENLVARLYDDTVEIIPADAQHQKYELDRLSVDDERNVIAENAGVRLLGVKLCHDYDMTQEARERMQKQIQERIRTETEQLAEQAYHDNYVSVDGVHAEPGFMSEIRRMLQKPNVTRAELNVIHRILDENLGTRAT